MDGRAWLRCTKWSGDQADQLVRQAVNLLRKHNFDINLDKTIDSGLGTEKLNFDGSLSYKVGIREISENPHKQLTIREALAPTVACFHEVCGHGGQWRNEVYKDEPLSKVLILNDLACKCSNEYYGVDLLNGNLMPRYFEQPHEIAAQYMALKMTQKFLSAVFDEEKADKLLCEYVNLRIAANSEFTTKPDNYQMEIPADGRKPYMKPTEPFSSMTQVYKQFQENFVIQVFDPVDYKVDKNSIDLVADYINNQKWPWKRIWSRNQINNISDRLTQTYVLAGLWLDQHETYSWMRKLPVFEHIEFPDNISQLIQNVPDYPNNEDLDLRLLTEDAIDFAKAVDQIESNINHNESLKQ